MQSDQLSEAPASEGGERELLTSSWERKRVWLSHQPSWNLDVRGSLRDPFYIQIWMSQRRCH